MHRLRGLCRFLPGRRYFRRLDCKEYNTSEKRPPGRFFCAHGPPPENAGTAVGCVATSYTFDTIFFEEECLGRFVQIESDPSGDGPAYLIEREEKLVGLVAATVYVDKKHCTGSRSIRWDMVPVRSGSGAFHPKMEARVRKV